MSASGTISGNGRTAAYRIQSGKRASCIISGSFTAQLQMSFDQGETWHNLSKNEDGDLASYSVDSNGVFLTLEPPEREGVLVSWLVSSYSSTGSFEFHP